jgi:ubiquinol-cytochrome c reductase cytochrome b subunit
MSPRNRRAMGLLERTGHWLEDRTGLGRAIGRVARHPVPPTTGWAYVLGSATLTAFMIQVVTGSVLATVYTPSTSQAYASLQFITNRMVLGHFLRGIHFFGASAMVLLIGLHMIRVFLYGSYKFPREASWLTGVVLLGLTLLMGFTGQLLRWDQNAIWSVVVGAEQAGRTPFIGTAIARFVLGGASIGGATLGRFFAFHVFMIPALIFGVVGLHLFLVLRNGISEPPDRTPVVEPASYRGQYEALLDQEGKPFWPHAAWRDVVFGAGVILVIALLAGIFGPPALDKAPNPAIVQAAPRPDWYLLWYFAVLALLPHGIENAFIIGFPLLAGLLLVLVPFLSNRGERRPSHRPWAVASVLVVVTMVASLSIIGTSTPWSPRFDAKPLPRQVIGNVSSGAVTGAHMFHDKGCEYCHTIAGYGGQRGPDLTWIADRLTHDQMVIRIMNGGYNMPGYASILTPAELTAIVTFLETRTQHGAKPLPRDSAVALQPDATGSSEQRAGGR